MKKVFAIFLMMIMVFPMSFTTKAEEIDSVEAYMDYFLSHTTIDPVTEIIIGGVTYEFSYEDGKRTAMENGSTTRLFEYNGDTMIRQRDELVMEFFTLKGLARDFVFWERITIS